MSLPRPMCFSCVHYDDSTPELVCAVFPDGIPEGIIESRIDHRISLRGEETFAQRPDRDEPDWEQIVPENPTTIPVTATATSAWKADKRKDAAAKGFSLSDGSFPIKDKTDWHKAKQALGRAKNRSAVIAHLKKRAKALGIPKSEYEDLTA